MNRGMEITPEVADSARSTIVEQVANGVSVRMAVLYLLLGGHRPVTRVPDQGRRASSAASRPTCCCATASSPRSARAGRGRTPRSIDADGLVALPGLVDLHTHLREPGREDAETVESGSRAAALGGYTAVCAMANTSPVADTAGVVEQVWRLGREAGLVDVQPIGAVTVGLAGERLAELGAMADSAARVRIFSDDGHCVADPRLMRRALEYVKAFDGVIAQHAEEPRLTEGAQMHEGEVSARLGLTGWPAVAEEAIIARDVLLAEHVGARLHVCHVSTAGSVEILRWAKARGRPGHRRGHPAPPAAHRRAGRAATTRCSRSTRRCGPTPTSPRCGAALVDGRDRRRRHRPRPARRGGQGVRVGVRPAGHARPGDGAVRSWSRRARRARLGPASPSGCRATPARIAGLAEHGHDPAPGRAGQPHPGRPGRPLDGRAGRAGQPQPQHPVRRA